MLLADSHLHLDRYSNEEISALLSRAQQARVTRFLTVGVDVISSEHAILLARQYTGVYAAVGWHPAFLQAPLDISEQTRLRTLAKSAPQVAAIGETGIDLLDATTPLDIQQQAFHFQLQLAQEMGLPLILHHQGAERQCQELIREARTDTRIIVHYFTGDLASARRWLDLGCFLSVGKPVTRAENHALREAISALPQERLLLETDTYPLPGRTTEPAHIRQIAEAVAMLKRSSLETIAEQTTANFCRLFHRDQDIPGGRVTPAQP